MKKLFICLAALLFIACSHDLNYFDSAARQDTYNAAFEKEFGEIAENQTWGNWSLGNTVTTRSANVNGNQWEATYELPGNITNAEREKVVAEFSKVRENAENTIHLPYNNYWVQQVYKGTSVYKDGYGNDVTGSDNMNKLIAYNVNYKNEVWWPEYSVSYGGYEHVNKFNNGNNTTTYYSDGDNAHTNPIIGTTLMLDMGTDVVLPQFGYHNSTDSKDHFEYIILEIDGSYYVGFDFYATHPEGQEANKNMDVERDWVFNDWIVKITPAEYNVFTGNVKRVIVEDLIVGIQPGKQIDSSDWDYNDVVFDVVTTNINGANRTFVKILAAGGTLPLYVENTEVHGALGVSTGVMVNTGAGQTTKPVTVELVNVYYDANQIPVYVINNGEPIILTAPQGKAPQKMCVPTSYRWCKERNNIKNAYPDFATWVQTTQPENWYSNASSGYLY